MVNVYIDAFSVIMCRDNVLRDMCWWKTCRKQKRVEERITIVFQEDWDNSTKHSDPCTNDSG